MKKVFLKRNLNKKIAELKKEYPGVKEIECGKDMNWEKKKKRGIRCIVNENRSIEALYKCVEKHDVKSANIIAGDYNYDNGYLNICSKSQLNKDINSNLRIMLYEDIIIKEDILYIKYSMPFNAYVYFNFYNDAQIKFYKEIKLRNKKYSDYSYENDRVYQLYIGYGFIGEWFNNFGAIFRNNIRQIENEYEYKIVLNLKDEYMLVNDQLVKINKFFIKNFILGRRLGIVSWSEDNDNLIIKELELGKKKTELCLKNNGHIFKVNRNI